MKKLVVVADDFGLCESVNDGIIDAYNNGIVTELSLMLGSPGTEDAVHKASQQGIDTIGLHCLLTFWKDRGDITRREDYKILFSEKTEDEIADLFYQEIDLFIKTVGRPPTHITSQYSICGYPKLLKTVVAYCAKQNIPMRIPKSPLIKRDELTEGDTRKMSAFVREHGARTTDTIFGHMLGDYPSIEKAVINDIMSVSDNQSAELLLHPGYVSDFLVSITSMVDERPRDVAIATSEVVKSALKDSGVVLVPYAQLP